jgi:predicted dithiol-disulfide oxidoreductase (DUF899 family)
MRTRHKIPTIFNLSMVDVLCCALGCVILLWLVNFREAKRRILAAGEIAIKLDVATRQLAEAELQLRDLQGERDAAIVQAEMTARDRAQVRAQLADVEDRLAKKTQEGRLLARDLSLTEKERAALQSLLRDKDAMARAAARDADTLTARLQKERDDLQALLRDKDAMARAAAKDADALNLRLQDADARLAKLRAVAERVPALEKDLAASRDKSLDAASRLLAMEKELAERTKELTAARSTIDELRFDKKLLTHQVTQARAEAENRFAGIALTGKRVVFLVDMSGSMDYVDEETLAPDKWRGVRETLAKIARSLPELEKFQVILFARETSFLLGNEGRWLDFDPKTSVAQVTKALAATKPKGATNMYAAFEAAFRYRAQGLDTIYLLSDGLPNVGTGLSPQQAAAMKETEKAEILGNYVRKMLKTSWNRPAADKSRVRINAVGFFYESPDVGAFLWALARENDGSFVGMSKP